jgi:hypothetical protein
MTLSMYQASVPTLERALTNLGEILKKGESFATEKEIDTGVLLGSRLAVDMFPLTRQVQIVSDSAKGCVSRLAGVEAPAWEDDEQSFAELYERIDKTIQYINSVPRDQIDGSEDKTVELKLPKLTIVFTGSVFLFTFALPNVFFHVTTAYNILRHCGVDIGKMDYLGKPPD